MPQLALVYVETIRAEFVFFVSADLHWGIGFQMGVKPV